MKEKYQLIIIGAGPAGAYAALTAAKSGLDILLLERSKKVGYPLACAEAVSHEGMTKFIDPDPSFIATEIGSISFSVATGYEFAYLLREPLGYVLDRPAFDSHLADKAIKYGAELQTGAYVYGIEIQENGPAKVSVETEDKTAVIEADYVIAADGAESMIGRMAGIDTLLELHQTDSNLQYRVSGIEVDPHRLEFWVGQKYSPDGYLWMFPKSDHSANIGVGLNPAQNEGRELRQRLDQFLQNRFGEYTVEFESCGMVPKYVGLDILGRDCLLLAGDAARTIDSLTGAGINRALHTGKLAAGAVIEAVEGSVQRKDLVQYYKDSVDEELGRDLRFFSKAHKVFRKFNDEDWESLARFVEKYLTEQKAGSVDPAALVKSALTGAPRLIRLARHLF